jgi:vancomycin resistance protein YoaR
MEKKSRVIKIISFLAIFLLALFLILNYSIWKNKYITRIYPGVRVGETELSGLTLDEAKIVLTEEMQKIETVGLVFQAGQKTATLTPAVASFDSDLSYLSLAFHPAETALAAFGEPSDRNFFTYLSARFRPQASQKIKALYTLDAERINKFLTDNFTELNITSSDAYFAVTDKQNEDNDFRLEVRPEKLGKEINYTAALTELSANLENLKNEIIAVKTKTQYPMVRQEDLIGQEERAQNILNGGELVLRFFEPEKGTSTAKYWKITPTELIGWLGAQKNNDQATLSLNSEKIKQYLNDVVSPEVNKEAVRPRFEMKNDRVTSWQVGEDGRQINQELTIAKIAEIIFTAERELALVVEAVPSPNLTADNDFQIKEVVGTGSSRFAGSPANRRHNINVGAKALHGLLIKPGEEFSLLKALGEITGETGYLPELVIKDNKTIPEFGGGLCQIGTTLFRTVLASGLPVTARRNHSYRVSYYEPAGTDATIYDPAPDFRFINDTGNYILIQSRIVQDDLYFDFWGVRDGRLVTTTTPVIYNIVKPAPTKIIETTDLAPGEKKCTESSHNGADAYFDYTVVYPEGATTTSVQERRFSSHYVPWQAVCLVGVTATSTPATDNTDSPADSVATSTSQTTPPSETAVSGETAPDSSSN